MGKGGGSSVSTEDTDETQGLREVRKEGSGTGVLLDHVVQKRGH